MSLPARIWTFLESRAEEVIAGICVVVMTVLVFLQVVMRYVFSAPMSWSDEIAVYAMLWSVYLSTSWAVRERAHIRVMNLVQMFPGKMSTAMTMFSDLIWFIFAIFLTYQSLLLHLSMWTLPFESPVLGIAQKWPYLCLVFGFGLMTLRLIQVYYRWIRFDEPLMEPRDGEVSIHE
ncbi:MAG: TRAP transporter small permease subunit [Alphaproteobacteria bacterium]|nr:TRAP transporter small permease subunit [Alphaproteobacteria bacterium]